jgi:DNA-binding SARP family transcriptional activator/Tfp pilus assembly protein PilF
MAIDDAEDGSQPAVLRVGVLGPVRAWLADHELPPGPPRQQAVLGVLAMRPNRVVSRDELVDAVWGQDAPASAEGGVHTYVAGLRRVLEPGRSRRGPGRVLASAGAGYVLRLDAGHVDAVVFERGLDSGRRLRLSGDLAGAMAALDGALGQWHGSAFAGVPGPFASAERARLGELRSAAAEEHAELLLELGRHEQSIPELASLVAEHPLRERMRGLLMIALYRCGRQAEALQVFHDARQVLDEELGIDPGPELSRIHQQILASDPDLQGPGRAPAQPATIQAGTVQAPFQPAPLQSAGVQSAAVPAAPVPAASTEPAAAPGRPASRGLVSERPPPPAHPAPAQLPLEAPGFSGRQAELNRMLAVVDSLDPGGAGPGGAGGAPDRPAPVQIIAIAGTAGVGKTALAIRFARQVARRYPDGQLYVNLRGFDPSGSAMSPDDALRYFLDAFAVPPQRIPADVEARAALYRSMLDGKRPLIVLDNARDADQVRPLLPGSPGSLVVVTSRSQLTSLVAAQGAVPLGLDVLTGEEAHEVLVRRLGPEVVAGEPAAAAELIGSCARLPLALSITVGRAAIRPKLSLAALAAELHDARSRLDALDAGDAATDLRAVLSWSYHQLSPAGARMFRLLGLHPGPDISRAAAVSLSGTSDDDVGPALDELTRAHMVAEHAPGRFTFHDLLRAYAVERARQVADDTKREQALRRIVGHYLQTAQAAAAKVNPQRFLPVPPALPAGVTPEEITGHDRALGWFEAEHSVLLAVAGYAADAGMMPHGWMLPAMLADYLDTRGHWQDFAVTQRSAVAVARRFGDAEGEARACLELGIACVRLGQLEEAEPHLECALGLYGRLGDRASEARVHTTFAYRLERQERYGGALGHTREALRLHQAVGNRAGEAHALNGVGWYLTNVGEHRQALSYCQEALALHRELGDPRGEAATSHSLGHAYYQLGDYPKALASYRNAVEAAVQSGSRYTEALSLTSLADTYCMTGDTGAARDGWERALAIFGLLRHPDAEDVRTKLRALDLETVFGGPEPGAVTTSH